MSLNKLRLFYGLLACVCATGCEPATVSTTKNDQPISHPTDQVESDAELPAGPRGWPQLYGPWRTGVAERTIPAPQFEKIGVEAVWQISIGTGYGSPVVCDDRVVFNHRIGDEDIVQCVDAATGQTLWEHRSTNRFDCKYEYSSGPYSTPVIHQERVYCVGGQGLLACLNLVDGTLVWHRRLLEDYKVEDTLFPLGSSPLVMDDKLVFNVGSTQDKAGIVAFSLATGETLWESTDHGIAYCTPFAATIHQQPFLFVMTKVGLVCLHPETGAVDWEFEHYSRTPMSYNAVSPVVYRDHVFIVAGPGPGAACLQLNPDRSYREVWHDRKVLDSQFNGLMVSDGCAFGFTTVGQHGAELRCVDILTGRSRWRYASDLRRGQGLIAGESLVLIGELGHLSVIKRSTKEAKVIYESTKPVFESPCFCSPAICDRGLLVKTEKQLRLIRCWPSENDGDSNRTTAAFLLD